MRLLFLLIVLFILPFSALADAPEGEGSDCTLQSEAIKSQIDFKSPDIKTTLPAKREQQHLEEAVVLKNGMTFTYDVGGCAHYAFNFRWDNVPVDMEPDQFALAKKLLRSAPLREKDQGSPYIVMLEALQKAVIPNELPCGTDAYCHLIVNKKPNNTLSVTLMYDFAM